MPHATPHKCKSVHKLLPLSNGAHALNSTDSIDLCVKITIASAQPGINSISIYVTRRAIACT